MEQLIAQEPRYLQASATPLKEIEKVTYAGQDPRRRMYRSGYEQFFNQLPVLDLADKFLQQKIELSQQVMSTLAKELYYTPWIRASVPPANGFDRTILAIEPPTYGGYSNSEIKEGKEIIVARWGDGSSSPVHGHAAGLLHEELLYGKIRVNTYRQVSKGSAMVRPLRTEIFEGGRTIISTFTKGEPGIKRKSYIHNFISVGQSASLHYVPEHTRDGRDNTFLVQYFPMPSMEDVDRISALQGMYLRKGDVVLVRSLNVPEYGDHYIVVTGHPVLKAHGMRVQDEAIAAPNTKGLLDMCDVNENGVVLLKLRPEAAKAFHEFHGITVQNGEVIFPEPDSYTL